MMDLIDKVSDQTSESEEMMSHEDRSPERVSSDGTHLKTCADCGTTKTPLWRGGPAGPKSLCNACGIRSRKKRRALMGINKEEKKPKKSTIIKQSNHQQQQQITTNNNNSSSSSSNTSTSSGESSNKYGEEISLKKKLLAFGGKVAYQRPRSSSINQRRKKYGEVEQAAFLLMSLSCASVFA